MATSYYHVQLGVIDSDGDLTVIYPQNYGRDVLLDTSTSEYMAVNGLTTAQLALAKIGTDIWTISKAITNCDTPESYSGYCSSTTLNTPYKAGLTENADGRLFSTSIGTTTYNAQLFIEQGSQTTWKRYKRGSTWTEWVNEYAVLKQMIDDIDIGDLSDRYAVKNHASGTKEFGGANATNYGHVRVSDNFTESAGAAADSVAASSKALVDGLGSKANKNHASTATTYGLGTSTNYGHVKLSDSYASSAGAAASGIAASSQAVYNAYKALSDRFTYGTTDLVDGESSLETGKFYYYYQA